MIRKMLNALKRRYVFKSSITGRYVSAAYAKAFPDVTYRERV